MKLADFHGHPVSSRRAAPNLEHARVATLKQEPGVRKLAATIVCIAALALACSPAEPEETTLSFDVDGRIAPTFEGDSLHSWTAYYQPVGPPLWDFVSHGRTYSYPEGRISNRTRPDTVRPGDYEVYMIARWRRPGRQLLWWQCWPVVGRWRNAQSRFDTVRVEGPTVVPIHWARTCTPEEVR